MEQPDLLYMKDITKRFGAFTANSRVNLRVKKGEIHALMGENGAGKSTLMNILSGLYQMDEGCIYFDGQPVEINRPQDARALGIGMVYQHFMLIQAMTVVENVMLSMKETGFRLNFSATRNKITELSQRFQLEVDPDKRVSELSVGQQQRVEIIKVLCAGDSRLIVLDEPTAVLTPSETEGLFNILRRLNAEGHTIIFISHKLKEVMELCDRITVLRRGETVAQVEKRDTTVDQLGSYMVGHTLAMEKVPPSECVGGPAVLLEDVRYCCVQGVQRLDIAHLEVRKGEILGVAGVDGNGQTELAQLLTGVLHPQQGRVCIDGEDMVHKSVRDFIDAHVALIPEDRNRMGLVGDMSIYENLALKNIGQPPQSRAKGYFIDYRALRRGAGEMVQRYDIRTTGVGQSVKSLSGGNQQKVILAREMESGCRVLVAVHPTRGVDIGATEYIHQKIREARDGGCAVLLISADLDEVLRLSDRCAVLFEGRIIGYADAQNPDMQALSLMMAGKEAGDENLSMA